ncbi:MAG TPA: carboxypeptidase regulatory-like domain-containing protein, partial [Blastocatellia bacterium]
MRHLRRMKSLAYAMALVTVAALLMPVLTVSALAQSSKGIIVGTVNDPSGAVVAGATVKITNKATNVTRETTTSSEGGYRLDAVDPGTYVVEVGAGGFKTTSRDNVIVAAAQATTSDFALEVGAQTEVVNVNADSTVILQQQDGARANTLERRQIVDLPVIGLNPVNLVFTLPGVTSPSPLAGGFVQGVEFNINGLRARSNNQLIDGTDNNDVSITGQSLQPVLRDGYNEVSILGGDNSAEYGRAGGAVVNVVTRSGTNQFHGSIYDVIDTSALSSLTPGQKANEGVTSVPVYIQNSFGFSLGGPIKKDKLFFFGTFQPTLTRTGGASASAVVPTERGLQQLRALFPQGVSANLDRYLGVVGNLRGTTNPFTVALGNGRPDIEFGTATIFRPAPTNTYDLLSRVDWTPNQNNSFAFRYLFQDQTVTNQIPTPFEGFTIDVPSRVQNFYLNYTRILSLRMTNEFRFSFSRSNVLFGVQDPSAVNFGPEIVFATSPISTVGALGGIAATFPQGRTLNNFQYQDTITYTRGTHTVRAGVDLLRQLTRQIVPFNNQGNLVYSAGGGFTDFANFVDAFSGTEGAFATRNYGSPVIYPDAFQQSYFVNDSWRARPNLTLNLGLRYENYGTPFNVVPFPAFAGLDAPVDAVAKQKGDNNNFAPRFSFAYTPHFAGKIFGGDRTVIRGGFGVGYDIFFTNILQNTAAAVPNVSGVTINGDTGSTPRGIPNAVASILPATGTLDPLSTVNTIAPNLVNPQTYTWNLGVQRELPGNFIVDAAYVGTRGLRLFINEQLNPGINRVRIDPNRGSIVARTNGGDSNYHSLQTRVERGFRNGFLFRFAYTYSKAIDDV